MDKMLATTHAGKSYLNISLTISAVWTTCPVSADDPRTARGFSVACATVHVQYSARCIYSVL